MLKIKLEKDGIRPTKAYEGDAGWDVYTPYEFTLKPGEIGKVNLGFKIQGEKNKYYRIDDKSGHAAGGLHIIGGIVDRNYTGDVHVIVQNMGSEQVRFEKGSKVAQLLVVPVEEDADLQIVEELEDTNRGDGGFGSSGK